MKAYVFLTTKPGTSEEVIKYLRQVAKVKGVLSVDSVYGRFDAIITLDAPGLEEIGELVYKVIEKIPNVTHSETSLVLSKKGMWSVNMTVMAYVLVKTKPGTSHELLASRKITGVKMANSVFGRYDVVLVIEALDMEDLSSRIYDVVEKHPNVEHTEVLVSLPWPPEEHPGPPPERDTTLTFNCPSCNSLNKVGATYCHFCGFVFQRPTTAIKKKG